MTTPRLSKPSHRSHSHRKDGHGKPRFLDELIRTNSPAFSAFYLEEPKLVLVMACFPLIRKPAWKATGRLAGRLRQSKQYALG